MKIRITIPSPFVGYSWLTLPTDACIRFFCIAVLLTAASVAPCLEYSGKVEFNGLPLPGARVTATSASTFYVTTTNSEGVFRFLGLSGGAWTIEAQMPCFVPLSRNVVINTGIQSDTFSMTMEPLDRIHTEENPQLAAVKIAPTAAPNAPAQLSSTPEAKPLSTEIPTLGEQQRTADGFLINGSIRNASTSNYSQNERFGNGLASKGPLYTGGVSVSETTSALDAMPYSLTGVRTAKPPHSRTVGAVSLGGPLDIPRLWSDGPNFFLGYQWTRSSIGVIQSALVPTLDQRVGNLPAGPVTVTPQAEALLNYFPKPNIEGNSGFNYQTIETTSLTQNAMQTRLNHSLGERSQLYGGFAFQLTHQSAPNLFGFVDSHRALGIDTQVNWWHRFGSGLYAQRNLMMVLTYHFSRLRNLTQSYFQNVENVSGEAGITGNNQEPLNWGPPALEFSSGIAELSDADSADNRNQTNEVSGQLTWVHHGHTLTMGEEFRRQEFNYFQQGNPRGTFYFTGTASGISDFADFLSGVPDASALVTGNPDKYLRQNIFASFITDDWRARPDLTVTMGFRWEYGAPITELKDRLVNLDIAPGFAQVSPVVASTPIGSLTGQQYPASLVRPDRLGFEPRIGIAWRPLPASSLVVRAGYGIYDDTSVYQNMALAMAEQAPLGESISESNSAVCPLSLANGFVECPTSTRQQFAADPNFRVGYAQVWQLSFQHNLPLAVQLVATYQGIKGTHGPQEILPNTYAFGGANPCPDCPLGFVFLDSNGNSTRQSGSLQLRRRLMDGLAASIQYTLSKSLDDDSVLGGEGPVAPGASEQAPQTLQIAQNWQNPSADRGLSTFDQRHVLNSQLQFTSGMGLKGGSLMKGWPGSLYREWTVSIQMKYGSGMPATPYSPYVIPGTAYANVLRANSTGGDLYAAPPGRFLNPAAFALPAAGIFGNARRDSITGPSLFTMDASLLRTFRLGGRYNFDIQLDSTNVLNHVGYTGWITTVGSELFGAPASTYGMRSMETRLRLRF